METRNHEKVSIGKKGIQNSRLLKRWLVLMTLWKLEGWEGTRNF
jgi:hypothetical protein